jgi:transglutaminase superfamily protein/coenzyme PQQ synthesis protein D (PqqD)
VRLKQTTQLANAKAIRGGEEVASLSLLVDVRERLRVALVIREHTNMTPQTSTVTVDSQPNLFTLIAEKHRDGTVLLSVSDDCICKLNGVGALTWLVLEQSDSAMTVDEVASELFYEFEKINARGEVLYDVSPQQLTEDTARFIQNLANVGLLEVISEGDQTTYRIKAGVSGTTSTTLAECTTPENNVAPAVQTAPEIQPPKRETFFAFWRLFAFDLLLRARGFEALVKKVESWPISEPQTTDAHVCRRVCAAVNRAQMYYPKKAMCLQHSAVVTCLLRRNGVPAQMVLAAQEFPPKAHAWADVAGTVVNDSQQVKTRYRELRRI